MEFKFLGVKWDKTQTFRKGASKAPDLIRKIFPKLENYVNGIDLSNHFLSDLGNVSGKNINEIWNGIYKKLFNEDGFPIIVGGDHLITVGSIKALNPDYFVVLDAHPDLEDSDKHDSTTRKVIDILGPKRVFLYGIRCMSKQEESFLEERKIIYNSLRAIKKLRGRIFLSVDLDILDPSILPAVGNPEPDGFSFKEVLDFISMISDRLIGVDFVEYTPVVCGMRDIHTTIVGKLIYSTMAEIVKKNKIF